MQKNYFTSLLKEIKRLKGKNFSGYRQVAWRLIKWNLAAVFKIGQYHLRGELLVNHAKHGGGFQMAIELLGGVGDTIINAAYVQELAKLAGNTVKITLMSPLSAEVIEGIFYNKTFYDQIYCYDEICPIEDKAHYDLVIKMARYPFIETISSKKMASATAQFQDYVAAVLKFNESHPGYAGGAIGDHAGVIFARINNKTRKTQGDINNLLDLEKSEFGIEHNQDYESILQDNQLHKGEYITLQRGIMKQSEATRLWPRDYFNELISKIKKEYPQYKICQVGRADTESLDGIDIDLRGKTNFEELKSLLKYAKLHIDCDCGMVHLRHFLNGGKSLVFWGPTSSEFIGYEENINLQGRACPVCCEWVTPDWNTLCIASQGPQPLCMARITPDMALAGLDGVL